MKVTLYTAPGCPFCMIIANLLKANKIKFKEVDISKDKKAKSDMKKKADRKMCQSQMLMEK